MHSGAVGSGWWVRSEIVVVGGGNLCCFATKRGQFVNTEMVVENFYNHKHPNDDPVSLFKIVQKKNI